MAKTSWLKNKLTLFKDDFEFRLETLIIDLTERICFKMKEKEINRIDLAGLLNVSPPAVTKILNGSSNFTLKTLLSLSDALGQDIEISFVDKEVASAHWMPVPTKSWNIATHADEIAYVSCNSTISGSGDTVIYSPPLDEKIEVDRAA